MAKFFICHKRLVGLSLSFFTLVFLVVFSVPVFADTPNVVNTVHFDLYQCSIYSGTSSKAIFYGTSDGAEGNYRNLVAIPDTLMQFGSDGVIYLRYLFWNPYYGSNFSGDITFNFQCEYDFVCDSGVLSSSSPPCTYGSIQYYAGTGSGNNDNLDWRTLTTFSQELYDAFTPAHFTVRGRTVDGYSVPVMSDRVWVSVRVPIRRNGASNNNLGTGMLYLDYSAEGLSNANLADIVAEQSVSINQGISDILSLLGGSGSGSVSMSDIYDKLDEIDYLLTVWNNNIMLLDDMAQDLTFIRTDTANIYSLLGQLRIQLSDIATHVSSIDSKLTLEAQDNLQIINYLRDISSKMDLISDFAEDVSDSEGVDATSYVVNRQVGSANDMIFGVIEDSESWSQGFIDIYHGGSGGSFGGSPGSGGAPGLMSALFTALHNQIPFTSAVFSVVAGAAIMIAIVRVMRGW